MCEALSDQLADLRWRQLGTQFDNPNVAYHALNRWEHEERAWIEAARGSRDDQEKRKNLLSSRRCAPCARTDVRRCICQRPFTRKNWVTFPISAKRLHTPPTSRQTRVGTTKMRQASIFFGSLNQTKTTKSGRTSPLNKVLQFWGTDHWTFCDPCPVVFTAMRTFRGPFAAMRSTAGAFIMPPVLTLLAVHPASRPELQLRGRRARAARNTLPVISTIVMLRLFARRQRTSILYQPLTPTTGLGLLASPRGGFPRSGGAWLGRSQKDGLPSCRGGVV